MSTFHLDLDVIAPITINPITINPLTINPLTLTLTPLTINPLTLTLTPLTVTVTPIDFTLRIKEIPSVRVHFPVDYGVCVGVLGVELLNVRLCGQAQVITEPYVPNPCECRPGLRLVTGLATPVSEVPQ
ncbi:MAG: hypothetical protein QOF14_1865 [Hyphomicrobiales bacterium]|jgi:hypothetical protein|nr:hypothetical protein [Hyphomicrobiales bacterium]